MMGEREGGGGGGKGKEGCSNGMDGDICMR